jgi:hypothetical protein
LSVSIDSLNSSSERAAFDVRGAVAHREDRRPHIVGRAFKPFVRCVFDAARLKTPVDVVIAEARPVRPHGRLDELDAVRLQPARPLLRDPRGRVALGVADLQQPPVVRVCAGEGVDRGRGGGTRGEKLVHRHRLLPGSDFGFDERDFVT